MCTQGIVNSLLDRADIEDVITKMYLYVDQRQFAKLATEVFAEEVEMDYSGLLGGTPYVTTGQKQAAQWEVQMSGYSATQHGILGILVDSRRRDLSNEPMNTASATANITATLVSPDGKIVRNGGQLSLRLKRTSAAADENQWRISSMKAYKGWMEGDFNSSALEQAGQA